MMPPSDLKRLALLMAVNCVRNTVIEDYHAHGKLSDIEMKAMNQEVANKIYTFLHYLFNKSQEDQEVFLNAASMMYPSNWDEPKLDAEFLDAVKAFKRKGNPIASGQRPRPKASISSKQAAKRKRR